MSLHLTLAFLYAYPCWPFLHSFGPSQVSRTQAVLHATECERETCNEGICLINHVQDLKRVLSEQKQKVELLP